MSGFNAMDSHEAGSIRANDSDAHAPQKMANEVLGYYQSHGNSFKGSQSELNNIESQLGHHYNTTNGDLDSNAIKTMSNNVSDILKPQGIDFKVTDKGGTMGNEYFALSIGDNKSQVTDNWKAPANVALIESPGDVFRNKVQNGISSPRDWADEADRVEQIIEHPSDPTTIFHGMNELSSDLKDLWNGGNKDGYNTLLFELEKDTASLTYSMKLGDMNPTTNTVSSAELVNNQGLPLFTIAQPGDTLWGIADRNPNVIQGDTHTYVKRLEAANHITDPVNQVKVGTSIFMADAG